MAYATAEDMVRVVGAARLQRLIPELQAESLTVRLDEALVVGAAKMDARIGHVYATPIDVSTIASADQRTAASAQLKRVNLFYALEYLTLGVEKLPAAITAGISSSDAWLASVAKRESRIPGLTSEARPGFKAFAPEASTVMHPLDDELFEAYAFI